MAALLSAQLSAAIAMGLIAEVGSAGTAWLRLTFGALVFLTIAPPSLRSLRCRDMLPLLSLGVATGVMTVAFFAAIERLPFGTAASIGFLGPVTVAAVGSHNRRALIWPALAMAGVVLLTEPWEGAIDVLGVAFAAISAVAWGSYILLTQHIGDNFTGISALSITVPIAALVAGVVGLPQAVSHLTVRNLAVAAAAALLMPILVFAFEMRALRRMTSAAFGTLLSLEPAIAVLVGLIVLRQQPSAIQVAAVLLIVAAGIAAQGGGRRGRTTGP